MIALRNTTRGRAPLPASACSITGWSQVERPRHHRRAVELLQPDRTVGEGAVAGHQEVRIIEQLDVLDVGLDQAVVEQQVQVTDPRLVRLLLGQPDVTVGVLVSQSAYDDRQDHVGHALEGADVDPAAARLEPVDGVDQPAPPSPAGRDPAPGPRCPAV